MLSPRKHFSRNVKLAHLQDDLENIQHSGWLTCLVVCHPLARPGSLCTEVALPRHDHENTAIKLKSSRMPIGIVIFLFYPRKSSTDTSLVASYRGDPAVSSIYVLERSQLRIDGDARRSCKDRSASPMRYMR